MMDWVRRHTEPRLDPGDRGQLEMFCTKDLRGWKGYNTVSQQVVMQK